MKKLDHPDLEIDNLPNRLTLFRVILIPFVLGPLLLIHAKMLPDHHAGLGWISAWTFAGASITDFLDGYIARKRGIVTIFGSFLDPVADKFLVVSSLIMLGALGRIHTLIVIILVLRELYMTSLRLLATTEDLHVPVSQLGKWKTATQMLGIPLLMAPAIWYGLPLETIGTICIYIASVLSVYSAVAYSMGLVVRIKHKRMMKKKAKEAEGAPITP